MVDMKNSCFFFKQEEECDDHKVQLRPPGFHVIFLPFSDDFRKVKYEQTPKGKVFCFILECILYSLAF